MKQLHKQSSTMSHRRDEENLTSTPSSPIYSPKSVKPHRSLPKSINYLLREQRLLFIFLGILIGSSFFLFQPHLSKPPIPTFDIAEKTNLGGAHHGKVHTFGAVGRIGGGGRSGRVPVGLGRRRMRVVVTGGAGFVGSHLVDKLMARGDDVIVIDNFFTGRKENVMHHFGDPRFELFRHDVVEPILLEVDQIYHLACPASPVHYKFNPIKTIISFLS